MVRGEERARNTKQRGSACPQQQRVRVCGEAVSVVVSRRDEELSVREKSDERRRARGEESAFHIPMRARSLLTTPEQPELFIYFTHLVHDGV